MHSFPNQSLFALCLLRKGSEGGKFVTDSTMVRGFCRWGKDRRTIVAGNGPKTCETLFLYTEISCGPLHSRLIRPISDRMRVSMVSNGCMLRGWCMRLTSVQQYFALIVPPFPTHYLMVQRMWHAYGVDLLHIQHCAC